MNLHPDLMDLLGAFSDSSVEYLVIGGWAVAFHSEPRFTKDLDLLIGDDDEGNLARAADALATFGAPASIVAHARSLKPDEFLFFGTPPVRVDVLRRIPGVVFREAWERRVEADWGGQRVFVISRADLIAAKRAAGRERDLRDLRALKEPGH